MQSLTYDAKVHVLSWCTPAVALILRTVDKDWCNVVTHNGFVTILHDEGTDESAKALEVLLQLQKQPEAWQGAWRMLSKRVEALLSRASHFELFRVVSMLVHCTDSSRYSYEDALTSACERGRADAVAEILKWETVFVGDGIVRGMCDAAENGHQAVVELLLEHPRTKIGAEMVSEAFCACCRGGHVAIVKMFLERHDTDDLSLHEGFEEACANGHTGVVKLLVEESRVDPTANNNYAIGWASEQGHTGVVQILLENKRVDPSANENYAIIRATENGHRAVVDLLVADGRADATGSRHPPC